VIRQDVLILVGEDPQAHGIFDEPTEIQRTVFCTVRSVGMNEFYRAMENALRPTFVFTLSDMAEYQGEKICIYQGVRYRVVRTYMNNPRVELTVEEATVDG